MASQLNRRICAALFAELNGSKVKAPEGSGIIWEIFGRLSRARSTGPNGPNPISFPEIESFMRLTNTPLEPRHIALLEEMDAIWIGRAYKPQSSVPDGVKTLPAISAAKLTPALFDLGAS